VLIITTGRLIMTAFGLGTVALVYFSGRRIMGTKGALIAALIAALTPGLIIWSQRLRPDEVAAFLVILTLWIALQIHDSVVRRQFVWIAVAALMSGVLLSFRFPLLVFGLMPLMAIVVKQGVHIELDRCWQLLFPGPFLLYLVGIPAGFLLSSPHSLIYPDIQLNGLVTQLDYQSRPFADALGQGPKLVQVWWSMLHQGLGYPFWFLGVGGLVLGIRRELGWTLILLISLVPYLFFMVATSWVVVRYTLPLLPLFGLTGAYALLAFMERFSNRGAGVLLGAVFGLTLCADLAYLRMTARVDARLEEGKRLAQLVPPDECIYMVRIYLEEVFYNPIERGSCYRWLDMQKGKQGTLDETPALTEYYRERFRIEPFAWLLMHEYHYANMERLQGLHPEPGLGGLYLALQELPLELVDSYKPLPVLLGLDFSAWFSAHDLHYANPGYKLYRNNLQQGGVTGENKP
jgi:hypothetical protein